MSNELVSVFKSLADPTRLRMIGLMTNEARSRGELASELGLTPPTVSHQLRRLREAGLLQVRRDPPYVLYRLDHKALRKAVQEVTDKKKVQRLAAGPGLAEETRKVIETFFDGDCLVRIPARRRKKEIVFEEILRRLPPQEVYEERGEKVHAVEVLQNVLNDTRNLTIRNAAYLMLGDTLKEAGRTDDAIEMLRDALSENIEAAQ